MTQSESERIAEGIAHLARAMAQCGVTSAEAAEACMRFAAALPDADRFRLVSLGDHLLERPIVDQLDVFATLCERPIWHPVVWREWFRWFLAAQPELLP